MAQSCLTLQPPGLQHSRLPCLSPTPGACSNSCPLSQSCHATICWDSNPAKTLVTAFRTKWSSSSWCLITERIQWEMKWWVRNGFIQIQREAHSTECGPLQRAVQPHGCNVAWLVFMGWVISFDNEWEDYFNYFWEGVEISRNWVIMHLLVFWQCLGMIMVPWVCHLGCWLRMNV